MSSAQRRSVILGTGSELPSKVVTNHDLEKMVETSDEWITVRTGIKERRVLEEGKGNADMAAKKKEIKVYKAADLGLSPEEVGEKGAREKVLTIGRPAKRQAGKAVTDEGEGGKQIADFLAEIKVI